MAQSDGAVFVYKLGNEWGEKKSICNKFLISNTEVTCLVWPKDQANNIIFGTMDGKVLYFEVKIFDQPCLMNLVKNRSELAM